MKEYAIYLHTNKTDGKKYVGITSKKPHQRWGKEGNGYSSQPVFYNAIQKYGWDNFDHTILQEGMTYENVLKMEIEISERYNTLDREFGYNLVVGKKGNMKLSESTRKKHSENATGENNVMYGKKHLPETIDKLRKINTENAMYGSANPASRAVVGTSKTGDEIFFESANQAAIHFNLHNNSHIIECCKGKRNTCAKHTWKYFNKESD